MTAPLRSPRVFTPDRRPEGNPGRREAQKTAAKNSSLWNQLEAAGYAERVADPTDGRAKIVRLAERGWEVRRVADEIMAGIEEECARRLGERKMRHFEDLVKEVSGVLQEDRARG